MFQGKLIAIRISDSAAAAMRSLEDVSAQPTVGLVGDRYANRKGKFQSEVPKPKQEVTLIETEAIRAASKDLGVEITHALTRRNLLTEDVPLNHLVDREFTVGDVVLCGVELCEPCKYLEELTGISVLKGFRHRGGLRAQVISGGTIRVGDTIAYTFSS